MISIITEISSFRFIKILSRLRDICVFRLSLGSSFSSSLLSLLSFSAHTSHLDDIAFIFLQH
jgi:hypothetical protein